MRILATFCLTSGILVVQAADPPCHGTVFIDPGILTESDPTTSLGVAGAGRGYRTMHDRRPAASINARANLFNASYDDRLTIKIQVNPELSSAAAAQAVAGKYGEAIGRLPTALRTGVETVWIHRGREPFGGGNSNILIHLGRAEEFITDGLLEEALLHEGARPSLDRLHKDAPGWQAAQAAYGGFVSAYARDCPDREDLAETIVPWFAVRCREDRISQATNHTIANVVPNRIACLDALELDRHPHDVRHRPLMTSSGLVRIINHSDNSGTVSIHAVEGSVQRFGPSTVRLDASTPARFEAHGLGLASAGGPWRLELGTTLRIQSSAYQWHWLRLGAALTYVG